MQDLVRLNSGRLMQAGMYLLALMSAMVVFIAGVAAIIEGWLWALPLIVLAASPAAMAILRVAYEYPFKLNRSFINPAVMSAGFVFGDFLLLPGALFLAGLGWQDSHGDLVGSVTFLVGCLLIGYVVAACFAVLDGARYKQAGVGSARLSPTKVWHDWTVMPSLVGLFVWALVPQAGNESTFATGAFVVLILFGVQLIVDLRYPVDPRRQHPKWDWRNFQTESTEPADLRLHASSI